MKFQNYSKLAVLALLLTFSACREFEDFNPLNPKKKNPTILVHEIVSGAAVQGANGMAFGKDGNLYIASFLKNEIVVMNKQNGRIIRRLTRAMGVESPDDLVFGPDGSLYWTETFLGSVAKMAPNGTITKQPVAVGVNPITFSPDGRLFVALDFSGDGLYELDPNLVNPPRPIVVATPGNPFPLGFLNGFDFGPDGALYGPIFAAGLVVRVNVDTPTAPTNNPYGDGTVTVIASGFTNPVAAKFDSKGVLHVLDQNGEVSKINITTGEKTKFLTLQPGLDNLDFDSKGTLFISNADYGSVVEILPSNQPRTISRGGMINPQGLAVLPGSNKQDNLYVADLFRLRRFNGLTGREISDDKGFLVPPQPGSLTTPFTVSADGINLIVSSWFGNKVQVWDPQTDKVMKEYEIPVPINAIRFKDDIAVATLGLGGVVLASDNSMVLPINGTTTFAPGGMATNGEVLWVADWGSGIVTEVSFNGKIPSSTRIVASGLSNPEGLAVLPDGSLVVVETGISQLSRIDVNTGAVTKIVAGLRLSQTALPGLPPTNLFDGVAVGPSGSVYVSGGGKNVIYRVSLK